MNKLKIAGIAGAALALTVGALALSGILPLNAQTRTTEIASLPLPKPLSVEELYPHIIEPRSTLSSALGALGVAPRTIYDIVEAARPVNDLGSLLPGTRFQIFQTSAAIPELTGIKFRFSPVEMLELKKTGEVWSAEKITVPVEIRIVTFSGVVKSSLWDSAVQAKMDPNLISELADVFAWQVDFAREVRVNDRWRISVEQRWAQGEAIGWGSILAAEYENAGQLYAAALFRMEGKDLGYFAPDGSSLRRMFLKSPLRYSRISSRFTHKRFHPILNISRAHLGVDYAAPRGTPIRAVGSGTVTFAAWNGGAGRAIKIRHNSVYMTAYKHLSGFAKGIRAGTKVQQGQIIGYVGSTGLSTGPHLHFEFFKSGRYVDPLGQKFPSADPVPVEYLTQFKSESNTLLKGLPQWEGQVEVTRNTASTEEKKSDKL
jgi:murein DD-endopeptidase MepM/ murein hydrolase activator NlpD